MTRSRLPLLLAGCAALVPAACSAPASQPDTATPTATASAAPAPAPAATDSAAAPDATPSPIVPMVTPVGTADGVNDGIPDLTPPPLTPEAERTVKGARNVLLSFARAIELKEFDQAWNMLDPAAKRRMSKAQFNAIFAGLDRITVAVPGGQEEGAAGSSYYTSQATITAKDKDGRPVRIEGPITLRRVNDVPGATPYQLHWHIEQLKLDWTH